MQNIENKESVEKQINIAQHTGDIYASKQSKFSRLFNRLSEEATNKDIYNDTLDELKRYITDKDGYGLERKLQDGGFTEAEIIKALDRKQLYWMKMEKNILYLSAQRIYTELLAKIIIDFETHIEPLIKRGETKDLIAVEILNKVVVPIFTLLNDEGADDNVLYFNMEEIYGMIYYLTGRCHLNWADYDSVSPSI